MFVMGVENVISTEHSFSLNSPQNTFKNTHLREKRGGFLPSTAAFWEKHLMLYGRDLPDKQL